MTSKDPFQFQQFHDSKKIQCELFQLILFLWDSFFFSLCIKMLWDSSQCKLQGLNTILILPGFFQLKIWFWVHTLNDFGNLTLEANLRTEKNYSGSMWPSNSTGSDTQVKTTGNKLRSRAEFWSCRIRSQIDLACLLQAWEVLNCLVPILYFFRTCSKLTKKIQ